MKSDMEGHRLIQMKSLVIYIYAHVALTCRWLGVLLAVQFSACSLCLSQAADAQDHTTLTCRWLVVLLAVQFSACSLSLSNSRRSARITVSVWHCFVSEHCGSSMWMLKSPKKQTYHFQQKSSSANWKILWRNWLNDNSFFWFGGGR